MVSYFHYIPQSMSWRKNYILQENEHVFLLHSHSGHIRVKHAGRAHEPACLGASFWLEHVCFLVCFKDFKVQIYASNDFNCKVAV